MVEQYTKACKVKSRDPDRQAEIVSFYLAHTAAVNNWDLVDSSAHKILGHWLLEHEEERYLLMQLADSTNLWEQRIAVIATLPLTQAGDLGPILNLSKKLLNHPHDLMHKAIGWMLREMGKINLAELRAFLAEHHQLMPRTMLRYAIEKLPPEERKRWMRR